MISQARARIQNTEDPYLSRITSTPFITAREDPVLYSNDGGILSQEQLSFYEKNGFLCFDSLFTQAEINCFLKQTETLKKNENLKNSPYTILEPESDEIRSFFHIHHYNPVFKTLACDKRILDIVEQILGNRVYLHQSRINLKPGFKGKGFYWHSDFETWHMEDGMPRMRALSCSIALTENNEFNGPLMLIPGTHKKFIACQGKTPNDNYKQSLRAQYIGVPDPNIIADLVNEHGIVAPKGKPGSVTFFECNTIHGSNSNISPYPRTNVFLVYNHVENALVDPYCDLKPRPEHIAVRNNLLPLEPVKTPLYMLGQ
jgi:ectoine hydroxylase